jgi:hypothetical protein
MGSLQQGSGMGYTVGSNLYFRKILVAVMWHMVSHDGKLEVAEYSYRTGWLVGVNQYKPLIWQSLSEAKNLIVIAVLAADGASLALNPLLWLPVQFFLHLVCQICKKLLVWNPTDWFAIPSVLSSYLAGRGALQLPVTILRPPHILAKVFIS